MLRGKRWSSEEELVAWLDAAAGASEEPPMGGDARRRRLPIQSAASSSRWRFGFLGARTST